MRKKKVTCFFLFFIFNFHIFFAKVIVLTKEKIAKYYPLKYNLTRMYSTSLLNNIKNIEQFKRYEQKTAHKNVQKVMNLD